MLIIVDDDASYRIVEVIDTRDHIGDSDWLC